MAGDNKKKCFVITPIGDENTPIRRHIDGIIEAALKPALNAEYEVLAAHHIGHPGNITQQIVEEIYKADLVVANLTAKNPNVMYELALRHSTGKPVIMIAEHGTELPSDLSGERTIFYYNDAQGVLELQEKLAEAAEEIKDNNRMSGTVPEMIRDVAYKLETMGRTNYDHQEKSDISDMDIGKSLTDYMDDIRRYHSQSLEELIDGLDIPRACLQKVSNRTGNTRVDTISFIAGCLEIDPAVLLSCLQTNAKA